jgi:Zn-dependent peptidase ImmA (M78 family)
MIELELPFLSDRQIEQAATDLLARFAKLEGERPRPPIHVENIVEDVLGVAYRVGDLRGLLEMNDVLGATWLEDGLMMIDSSVDDHPGRFSFTLAHEAGHWFLHKPYVEMKKVTVPLFPREDGAKPTPAIVCRSGKKKIRQEIQADAFAACLLMPANHVRAAAKAALGEPPLRIDGLEARRKAREFDPEWKDAATAVIEAGNFLNVSNESMRIRLAELKLVVDGAQQALF